MNRRLSFTLILLTVILFNDLQLRAQDLPFTPNNPDDPCLMLQAVKNPQTSGVAVIRFDDRVSLTYNPVKDKLFKPSYSKVSLAAVSANDKDLSVFTVPFPNEQNEQIKLNVNATDNGAYSLVIKNGATIPDLYEVWLKDAYKNDSVNIKTNGSYTFSIDNTDTTTFGPGRFTLIISQKRELAYQLLDFTAGKTSALTGVKLDWKTANEHDNTNFTAERSNDGGKNFIEVGGMQSNGSSVYALFDKSPAAGTNLYRLKQIDFNNHVTYSEEVSVQFGEGNINKTVPGVAVKNAL